MSLDLSNRLRVAYNQLTCIYSAMKKSCIDCEKYVSRTQASLYCKFLANLLCFGHLVTLLYVLQSVSTHFFNFSTLIANLCSARCPRLKITNVLAFLITVLLQVCAQNLLNITAVFISFCLGALKRTV